MNKPVEQFLKSEQNLSETQFKSATSASIAQESGAFWQGGFE